MCYNYGGHNLIYKESKRGILRQFPYGDCVQQFASLCKRRSYE
jgi:hypothetical protein